MKRILTVVAIALASAIAPAHAARRPPIELIGPAYVGFLPLGPTTGYYDRTPRELRIVTPSLPRGRAVATPEGCTGRGVSLPDRLLFCDEGPSFRLLDTNSGAVVPIDTSPCGSRDRLNFGNLGRYWIGGTEQVGTVHGLPVTSPIYLNRTTGTCRSFDTAGVRDVDRPDLPKVAKPRCADSGLRHLLRWHLPDIDVVFCHSKRKPLRLCHVGCGDAALGLHSAGWLTRTRLYAATLASGRRFSWKLAPLANGRGIDQAFVAFVGDRLYLTLVLRDPAAPDGRGPILIFSTRVPAGGS